MCHASYARPRCLILLDATDVFGRNAHGLRQKVFDSFVALPLGRERREVLRVVGGHGLAAVIHDKWRLVQGDFGNARGDSGGIQAHYSARRYTKDHGFAASVLDQCLQVFNLAFPGEGLGIAAVAAAPAVVVVDREVFAQQFGQLCHKRVKGTIRRRTVDQDDGWAGPNLVESNFRAVLRSDCWHGILLFFPFYETVSTLTTGWTTTFAERGRLSCSSIASPGFALSLSRLIGEDHGSGPGRFCREQVQSLEAIPIFEETLSTARNHRVDQENQLIQQALFLQRADEGWTSGSADVLSWLLLQPSDFLGEIALDQCRVLPCFHALQGGRKDILRRGVNKARKRFIRSSGPVGGPLLIGHAPQQDSVLRGELFRHGLPHILIEVLLPFIGRLHDPIEGDKQTGNDFSHAQYSFDADLFQRHFVRVNLDMKRLEFG